MWYPESTEFYTNYSNVKSDLSTIVCTAMGLIVANTPAGGIAAISLTGFCALAFLSGDSALPVNSEQPLSNDVSMLGHSEAPELNY